MCVRIFRKQNNIRNALFVILNNVQWLQHFSDIDEIAKSFLVRSITVNTLEIFSSFIAYVSEKCIETSKTEMSEERNC